jgi:hypothetical protein
MSKQKGVSAEEKRTRMLQIFYEKKEFFQLKVRMFGKMHGSYCSLTLHLCLNIEHVFSSQELEKIAPREKGIIEQSVKDVVQSLVDDGLVDTDKIGTSVYFWAFPRYSRQLLHLMNQPKAVPE